MKLRPYQEDLVNGARQSFRNGHKGVVLVASTGAGKTPTLCAIISGAVANGKRVLVLAHRMRLLKQIAATLDKFGVCYQFAGRSRRSPYLCTIGMVESVRRRMGKMQEPDIIIVDECQHACSSQYLSIHSHWPNARRIGMTATPSRTDGKGLGEVYSDMVLGPSMAWLIENGYLARYRYLEIPLHINLDEIKKDKNGEYNEKSASGVIRKAHIVGDVIENYHKYLEGKTAIIFCTGIDHAKEVAAEFNAAGIKSSHIDGTMSESEQEHLLDSLGKGDITCLASADLIGEGVDVSNVYGVILLRPTQSVVVFLQQVGRALRLKSDGGRAIILDHVGNVRTHGYPADERKWSLDGAPKREGEIKSRTCDKCGRVFDAYTAQQTAEEECSEEPCPVANGISRPVVERITEVIDAELIEREDPWEWAGGIDPVLAAGAEYQALMAKADTEDKLKQIQRARGYNARWVTHMAVQKGLRKKTRSFSKYEGKR